MEKDVKVKLVNYNFCFPIGNQTCIIENINRISIFSLGYPKIIKFVYAGPKHNETNYAKYLQLFHNNNNRQTDNTNTTVVPVLGSINLVLVVH